MPIPVLNRPPHQKKVRKNSNFNGKTIPSNPEPLGQQSVVITTAPVFDFFKYCYLIVSRVNLCNFP
jgi:hypothetical protein